MDVPDSQSHGLAHLWGKLFPHASSPSQADRAWILRENGASDSSTLALLRALDHVQYDANECNNVLDDGTWSSDTLQQQRYPKWGHSGFGFDVYNNMVTAMMVSIVTSKPLQFAPPVNCWMPIGNHKGGRDIRPGESPIQYHREKPKSRCEWHFAQGVCESGSPTCLFLPVSPCSLPPLFDSRTWAPPGLLRSSLDGGLPTQAPTPPPSESILHKANAMRNGLNTPSVNKTYANGWWARRHMKANQVDAILSHIRQGRYRDAELQAPLTMCSSIKSCMPRLRFATHLYLTRPNWRVREHLRGAVQSFLKTTGLGQDGGCAVMHVRRGDIALHTNNLRRYVKLTEYLERAEKKLKLITGPNKIRHILLLTDSQTAIDEARNLTEFLGMPIKWSWIDRVRSSDLDMGWESHFNTDNRTQESTDMLLALALAAESGCGTAMHSNSGFGKLVEDYMCAGSWDRSFTRWACPITVSVDNRVHFREDAEKGEFKPILWEYRILERLYFDKYLTWPPVLDRSAPAPKLHLSPYPSKEKLRAFLDTYTGREEELYKTTPLQKVL